ncbi:MAG: hypothetical protein Wins2KO_02760 [Winogradskyella sp.]
MKQLFRVLTLCVLISFTSCQNESADDTNQNPELRVVDGIVVGDGEEDKELMFNKSSEILMKSTGTASNCDYLVNGDDLPSSVSITTTAKPGSEGYFSININDSTDVLTGSDIPAWCVDVDLGLGANETHDFTVYSSYEPLPSGAFEHPENFDKVNWLLNQTIIGENSPNGLGAYTFGHIQYAIWDLIDDFNCNSCTYLTDPIGNWNSNGNDIAMGQELVNLAKNNGAGFTPQCGDKVGVVLIPNNDKQPLIIMKDLPEPEVCNDCLGKVNNITFKWDWPHDWRVRLYQRYKKTCYAVKIFDDVVGQDDLMSVSGANPNGTFGKWIYVYVGNCYYTKFKTNCSFNIGPGYKRGVVEVVSGTSTQGGELCEYEYQHCW